MLPQLPSNTLFAPLVQVPLFLPLDFTTAVAHHSHTCPTAIVVSSPLLCNCLYHVSTTITSNTVSPPFQHPTIAVPHSFQIPSPPCSTTTLLHPHVLFLLSYHNYHVQSPSCPTTAMFLTSLLVLRPVLVQHQVPAAVLTWLCDDSVPWSKPKNSQCGLLFFETSF